MSISQYSTNLSEFVYQTCVEFPVSALTIPRQRQLQPNTQPPGTPDMPNGKDEKIPVVSDRIYELCNSTESVSAMLAKDPTMAPGDAWKKLYGHHVGKDSGSHSAGGSGERRTVEEALEKAARCGKWGPTQPSELFLRVRPSTTLIESLIESSTNRARSTMMPCVRWRKAWIGRWSVRRLWEAVAFCP